MKKILYPFILVGIISLMGHSVAISQSAISQSVLDFDGINDFVVVPGASAYIANSPMSLSAWVYPTNSTAGWPDFDGIIGFRNDANADFYLLQLSSTSIEARFRNSSGINYDIVYTGLNLNAWNHFVFTYNNSLLTLYHDGVSVMTLAASGSISSTTQALNIGYLPFSANPFYFDGQLDDVALWNTSLNATQAADLYSGCGIDTAAANLVLAYEFNQGTPGGNNAGISSTIDSKNNVNGTMSGFALTGTSSNFVGDTKPVSANNFSLTAYSCGPYSSPSGNYMWTTTGIYMDTILAVSGCDSIYTIDLTVGANTYDTLTVKGCDIYQSPSGNHVWAISGLYQDTLLNSGGCDSVITIDLTLGSSNFNSINIQECDSFMSPSGLYTWTSSGVYADTITNSSGCDSLIEVHLTIQTSTSDSFATSSCTPFTSPSGKYVWETTGIYRDTVSNTNGCNHYLTIALTIEQIDTTVSQSNDTLSANAVGLTYQWLDCNNNFAPVSGATTASFSPQTTGSYAVAITQNGCTDTSDCHTIDIGSWIREFGFSSPIQIFPNPASDEVFIDLGQVYTDVQIEIFDLTGKKMIQMENRKTNRLSININHLAAGTYFVKVNSGKKKAVMKLMVN